MRKIAVVDLLTSLPFGVEVPIDVPMETLEIEKAYFASLKVYTARNLSLIHISEPTDGLLSRMPSSA